MAESKWDRELAKIDKQLETVSDEALFPTKPNASPTARADIADKRSRTSTLGVLARLLLATALAIAILFWPYDARCGLQLAYYLAAVVAVTASGVWSAIWSWRLFGNISFLCSLRRCSYSSRCLLFNIINVKRRV